MTVRTIPELVEPIISAYPQFSALSMFNGESLTFQQMSDRMEQLSAWLVDRGIKPGDKVALFSPNQNNWGVVYLAVVRMGAIIVPILPDFSSEEASSVIAHSEAKILFYSKSQEKKLADVDMEKYTLEDLPSLNEEPTDKAVSKAAEYRKQLTPDALAALIYTSGTTGKSKGVMLTHENIAVNVQAGMKIHSLKPGENALSILPLAHTYECSIGFLLVLACGAHVVYFGRPPAPAILIKALAEVRPHIMLSVPLLIEKIYRGKVAPTFKKNALMRGLYAFPPTRKVLDRVAGKKLNKTFGGRLEFFGIGGAPLAEDVEQFLRRANFPYAIGYGLTETSPLIAGGAPHRFPVHSTGKVIDELETRLTSEGELQVKGPTVMQGYYGEPELTREVLSEDGWFSTGDLCAYDEEGNLFIKGRKKNVIIGANGENIYPEVLESIINEQPFVEESLVTDRKGQLVAMIHFNYDSIKEHLPNLAETKEALQHWVEEHMEAVKAQVNKKVGGFSRISETVEQKEPFIRTATKKIKRFLYSLNDKKSS